MTIKKASNTKSEEFEAFEVLTKKLLKVKTEEVGIENKQPKKKPKRPKKNISKK